MSNNFDINNLKMPEINFDSIGFDMSRKVQKKEIKHYENTKIDFDKNFLVECFSINKKRSFMFFRCFAWRSTNKSESIQYIYKVKHDKIYDFALKSAQYIIQKIFSMGFNFNNFIITTPPRGNSIKIGWTLSFEIAKIVADALKIEYIQAFKDKSKSAKSARDLSCKINFELFTEISNKNIILLDDIITTGTTMETCVNILNKNNFVLPICLIYEELKGDNTDGFI